VKNVGRKFYHVAGGLFLLGLYLFLGRERAFFTYLLLFLGVLAFDLTRLRLPSFNAWALERMGTLIRAGEAHTLSGSPTYILGVALSLFLFELPVAIAAVLFLAFGDVAATIVGESWGRTRFLGKSLEGTAAFIVAGIAAGTVPHLFGHGLPLPALFAGAVTAAVVEVLTPRRLNDNLTIPLISGAVMTLLRGALT
jgi:dolichol kinase